MERANEYGSVFLIRFIIIWLLLFGNYGVGVEQIFTGGVNK